MRSRLQRQSDAPTNHSLKAYTQGGLALQTSPISSGLTRNSGAPIQVSK